MLIDTKSQFSSEALLVSTSDDSPNLGVHSNSIENDIFDDVFSSDHDLEHPMTHESVSRNDISDIPRLRSIHSTAGYREGLTASKETHVQEGFDEGYMLGAEVGMRAGWILGVLGGIVDALTKQKDEGEGLVGRSSADSRRQLREARTELGVKSLYGEEYFGQDGIWKYDVPVEKKAEPGEHEDEGKDGEEDLDFRRVASAHPLISKWTKIVEKFVRDLGLDLGKLKDKEDGD